MNKEAAAVFLLVVVLTSVPLLVVLLAPNSFASRQHHSGGGSEAGYNAYYQGLDDGTRIAQNGQPAPIYDDCIADPSNQEQFGNLVGAYCQGVVNGYYYTMNSLNGGGTNGNGTR